MTTNSNGFDYGELRTALIHELAAAEAERTAALDKLSTSGNDSGVAAARDKCAAVRQRMDDLEAAKQLADQREFDAQAAQRLAGRAEDGRLVREALDVRLDAAAKIDAYIASLAGALRRIRVAEDVISDKIHYWNQEWASEEDQNRRFNRMQSLIAAGFNVAGQSLTLESLLQDAGVETTGVVHQDSERRPFASFISDANATALRFIAPGIPEVRATLDKAAA